MVRTPTALVLALGLAGATAWWIAPAERLQIDADGGGLLADSDDDFLPDVVEWVVMTNAADPNSDGDDVCDFVEVVQDGSPRYPDDPMALDHEMRVVMTSATPGSIDQTSWLHVLMRFATESAEISAFSVWFEPPWAPGLRLPLEGLFAGALVDYRVTQDEGMWMRASLPLLSAEMLQALLPCGFYGEVVVDGLVRRTGMTLLDLQGDVVTVVPFGPRSSDRFAFQTIAPPLAAMPASNRVCVIDLREVGAGPGGTVFEVAAADCEDCNELECGASCAGSVGWILTIPGGMSALRD